MKLCPIHYINMLKKNRYNFLMKKSLFLANLLGIDLVTLLAKIHFKNMLKCVTTPMLLQRLSGNSS